MEKPTCTQILLIIDRPGGVCHTDFNVGFMRLKVELKLVICHFCVFVNIYGFIRNSATVSVFCIFVRLN